jgi:hypothetical protein
MLKQPRRSKDHALLDPSFCPIAPAAAGGISRSQVMGAAWSDLRCLIQTLSLELQAFCLNEGYEIRADDHFHADDPDLQSINLQLAAIVEKLIDLNQDWQIVFNLWLRHEGQAKLKRLVEVNFARINDENKDDPFTPIWRVDSVRQRVLLALAVRQLIHCMAHPENLALTNSTDLYDTSQWSWARFRIKDGKVRFEPSVLIGLLEGVKVDRVCECPICFKYFWASALSRKDPPVLTRSEPLRRAIEK